MKVIQVKCGSCGAGLDVQDGEDWVTCEYCGTRSRIQRRTGMFSLEDLGTGKEPVAVQNVPRTGKVLLLVSLSVVLLGGLSALLAFRMRAVGSGSEAISAPAAGPGAQWEGVGSALLADVNGDGVIDPVGRVRYVRDQDAVHLAAFDGRTGARLWESVALGAYTDTYQGKASIAGGAVLFGSSQGELHAYALRDGKRLWRIPLGEKTESLCLAGEGLVAVKTTDGRLRSYKLADGTPAEAEAGGGAGTTACRPLPDDRRDWVGRAGRAIRRRTKIKGMDVSEVYGGEAGPRLAAGTAEPGSRVPMVALLSPDGALRWKSEVPGQNRLAARETAPELVAFDDQHVVAIYQKQDSQAPAGLAVFGAADGRRLWERPLGTTMPTSAVQLAGDRVLVSSWGRLDAYQVADGKLAYTIGWSMK